MGDELLTDQQTAVGLTELVMEGLIRFRSDDEILLTDEGIDYAWALFHSHTPKEMVALSILLECLAWIEEHEEVPPS